MTGPALTVVVLAGPWRDRAERVLVALSEQTARASLDVVVADGALEAAPLRTPPGLDVRIVSPPRGTSFGGLRAAGVSEGGAPLVAFLEDHCYPDPGWAAAVIEGFDGGWAAVGYAFRNANPRTWASRTAALSEYGQWLVPVRSGPRKLLAGSNVAYRREALDAFGDRLAGFLDVDFNLQRALLARGEQLYIAEAAVVTHEHFDRLRDTVHASALYCGVLAQRRSGDWGLARRVLYAALVPLVAPVRRFQGLIATLPGRPTIARGVALHAPAIAFLFLNAAVSESMGYLRAGADLPSRFLWTELDQPRILVKAGS